MEEDLKEGKHEIKGKVSKKRKVLVFLTVLNILLVGFAIFWYFELRPWTIFEVAEAAGYENEDEWSDFYVRKQIRNPGFSLDMEGREITVRGKITGIRSIQITLGPLTYYELDDFEHIHLIEWKKARYSIGDIMEKRVYFERSNYNEQYNIYSPQLDFPVLDAAPSMETAQRSSSYGNGVILLANQSQSNDLVKISVKIPNVDGYPLEFLHCSLKSGTESHMFEMHDASRGYMDNPIIDSISSLSNKLGKNQLICFTDANQNNLFDDGDYFSFNVSKPKSDSAILTYLFTLNGGTYSSTDWIVWGSYYIIMTNRGILSSLYTIVGENYIPTFLTSNVSFEYANMGNTTIIVELEQVIGKSPKISEAICQYYTERSSLYYGAFADGNKISQDGIVVEFSDKNNNSFIDKGDRFLIQGLEKHTDCRFKLFSGSIGFGTLVLSIDCITGIGIRTGSLPLVQFGDPSPINSTVTGTFKIEIEKIYGNPGLDLLDEHPHKWFMIRITKDGQEVLTPINLTLGLNLKSTEINISFIDFDENNFINAGDYFICQSDGTGEQQLIFDYVKENYSNEDELDIIFSQSISWTI